MSDEVEAAEQQEADAPSAFSLTEFESMDRQEEGVWFTPRHPETGRLIPWRLLIAGVDSKHYAEAMNAVTALRSRKQQLSIDTGPMSGFDYREVKDSEIMIASYITLDWEPLVSPDGTPIPCNAKNKASHYKEHRWLADQVITFCRNRANFLSGIDEGIV